LLTSAGSPESAMFAAREGMDIGFFAMPLEVCAKIADIYRQEARRCGWEPTADNILYRATALVADTDEEALELCVAYDWGHLQGILEPTPQTAQDFGQLMGGVLAGGWAKDPAMMAAAFAKKGNRLPVFLGSPETVIDQLRQAQEVLGFGRFDLITSGDLLPFEPSARSLQLFGERVIPAFSSTPATIA
jgi:alkanesulfonate monooxygenase SsuD/methylene tetrahydromethanopterin reductase-like flavin-dependent oxidoreductase (luciferase family)